MDTRNQNSDPIDELPGDVLSALGSVEHVDGLRAGDRDLVWSRVGRHRPGQTVRVHSRSVWAVMRPAVVATVGIVAVIGAIYVGGSRTALTADSDPKVYATVAGERASITLRDGSRVTLGPATQLKIQDRIVELVGEAHFDVRTSESEPFIVRTSGTETRVLGTSFIVRKYSSDEAVSVAVGDGKVAFQSTVLSAGQGARASSSGAAIPMSDSEVASALGRTSGRLSFERAKVKEVIAELERWYGVEFRGLTQELLEYHITATFTGERLSSQTVQTLSIALNSRAVQNGRVITFYQDATEQER